MGKHIWLPETKHLKHRPSSHRGSMRGGGRKVVLHTTEGGTNSFDMARYLEDVGYEVHFVADPIHRMTVQCLPLNASGFGLAHPSGPETNRANAIQIEIVGFSYESTARKLGYNKKWAVENWGEEEYDYLAHLLNRIHRNFKFPLRRISFRHPRRMSGQRFYDYGGVCGHVHVPGNLHSDPGTHFRAKHLVTLTRELHNKDKKKKKKRKAC